MAYDTSLAGRIQDVLVQTAGVEAKKMFGGIGFLLGGNMLVGVWKDFLFVRVGPDGYRPALEQPGVREFDVTGRPMTGWILVEPAVIEDDDALRGWIEQAIQFVNTLPKK